MERMEARAPEMNVNEVTPANIVKTQKIRSSVVEADMSP